MAKDLYLKLMSGETVHVTDSWDGAAPTEEGMVDSNGVAVDADGKEVSEPWRNIFRYDTEVFPHAGSPTVGKGRLTLKGTALVPATVAVENTIATALDFPMAASLGSLTVKTSDDVQGTTPRQFAKVYTWLIFAEETGGTVHKWRKAEVMGWGCMAPIDI